MLCIWAGKIRRGVVNVKENFIAVDRQLVAVDDASIGSR
jgi:hypothetical protein